MDNAWVYSWGGVWLLGLIQGSICINISPVALRSKIKDKRTAASVLFPLAANTTTIALFCSH